MTYGVFLLLFLLLPIGLLAFLLRRFLRPAHFWAGGLVCLLAFVYTTPWDNYAAYKKLWTFSPAFVWGPPFWAGYLPLEEYLFYFAEGIFVCFVTCRPCPRPLFRACPGQGGVMAFSHNGPLPPAPSPKRKGGACIGPSSAPRLLLYWLSFNRLPLSASERGPGGEAFRLQEWVN